MKQIFHSITDFHSLLVVVVEAVEVEEHDLFPLSTRDFIRLKAWVSAINLKNQHDNSIKIGLKRAF